MTTTDDLIKIAKLSGYDHMKIVQSEIVINEETLTDWKRIFIYPPQNQNIDGFGDIACVMITEKLEELIDRQDKINSQYNLKRERVMRWIKRERPDEMSAKFLLLRLELLREESFFISKWIRYYLNLYEQIPEKKDEIGKISEKIKKEFNNEAKIKRAKEVSIENLYGGELKRSGTRLVGRCPFHEEKTPSFYIFKDNTWHCFGCGFGGDAINYVMKDQNIPFLEALEILSRVY